jgi:hypothetical protein
MGNLEAAENRLSFDDILVAVEESKRGRWFLQEYARRIQAKDSTTILDAIGRLEQRMHSLAPQAANPDEMAKVKLAIANARADIVKLGLGNTIQTAEGRLFAGLADMARKSMPVAVDSNAGIVRTLQLVDEIDRTLDATPGASNANRYFSADANLFERLATQPKPALVEVEKPTEDASAVKATPAPAAKEAAPALGAKLVIRKAGAADMNPPPMESPKPVEVAQETVSAAATVLQDNTHPEMPAIDNPRIVIIRRRAEDMPEVDVTPSQAAESAA